MSELRSTGAAGPAASILRPETAIQLRDIVAAAVSQEEPLAVEGTGSKGGLGRPVQAARTLSLSAMTGVTLYEPEELVLSARVGTPIAEIETLLDEAGQRLEFEPLDYGPLHGLEPGLGTIGGVVACNLAGPRRLKHGAARDHILGVHAVSGRGEMFKSGGRVVKNVTGYDLSKGLTGSFGTLAVMTDVTLKVLPKTETETTIVLRGLADDAATGAMAAAMGSSAEASGAAHLPMYVASRVADGHLGNDAATLIRLEGFGPSVAARSAYLSAALERVGKVEHLEGEESRAVWRDVRDIRPFVDGTDKPVWRLSVTPTRGHEIVMSLRMQAAIDAFYDWQGGLVWLRMEGEPEAELVRETIRRFGGGHATLVRASESVRAATAVFQPQPGPLAGLASRLKQQFDPAGVLNPGRMG
ncbi:glycolate oxidase subunit GlcE [Aurantimonas coralicida]|uniref:glycolate oxidase subunit GlcE n=1 Tax=Aurantimonas coralicida TaxID=182270 RepID=UPI00239018DE|nr:glycolate oxidase subunit GlcE [Aurantimonas coralicida]MDE0924559.1 glycolate oxidase subunit GlcE [Aurantimonas coralicida]